MVRSERKAQNTAKLGHGSTLRNRLIKYEQKKRIVGQLAGKINKRVAEENISRDEAIEKINKEKSTKVYSLKRSGLSVEFAVMTANLARNNQNGSVFLQIEKTFRESWKRCWNGLADPPRKKIAGRGAESVAVQIQNDIRFKDENGKIDIGKILPGTTRKHNDVLRWCPILKHRELPGSARAKTMRVKKCSSEEWHVILSCDVSEEDYRIEAQMTGESCGIDPGRKTAFHVVSSASDNPGMEGDEISPGRPYARAQQKLRRLQRRLDRQRRANNPDCYDSSGRWKKGYKLKVFSENMKKSESEIRSIQQRCRNIRKELYHEESRKLVKKFDLIALGDWKDPTPKQRRTRKQKRNNDERRPKGEAARARARNRADRDNSPGMFREMLKEKAERSQKKIVEVPEGQIESTKTCIHCGAKTGPTGLSGLNVRGTWKCSACNGEQHRDYGAAWNILQAGIEP